MCHSWARGNLLIYHQLHLRARRWSVSFSLVKCNHILTCDRVRHHRFSRSRYFCHYHKITSVVFPKLQEFNSLSEATRYCSVLFLGLMSIRSTVRTWHLNKCSNREKCRKTFYDHLLYKTSCGLFWTPQQSVCCDPLQWILSRQFLTVNSSSCVENICSRKNISCVKINEENVWKLLFAHMEKKILSL